MKATTNYPVHVIVEACVKIKAEILQERKDLLDESQKIYDQHVAQLRLKRKLFGGQKYPDTMSNKEVFDAYYSWVEYAAQYPIYYYRLHHIDEYHDKSMKAVEKLLRLCNQEKEMITIDQEYAELLKL